MTKTGITALASRRLENRVVCKMATYFLGALLSSSLYAAPEDFIGNFNGTENVTTSECSNPAFNGTKTSFWSLRTGNLQGASYKGNGRNDNGDFAVEGEVSGNNASGKLKGTNRWGHAWTGEHTTTFEDGKLFSVATGHVPALKCRFRSEIEATKETEHKKE